MSKILNQGEVVAGDEKLYKPLKTQITMRVDADVLAWFRSQGKGYLSKMNAVLREEMLKSSRSKG